MKAEILHLKNYFDFLGKDGKDPMLSIYIQDNLSEMNRQNQKRPCILICPGGGYTICSTREAEPIALNFLPEGYNIFILWYSTAPHRFPSQLTEAAAALELIFRNAREWHCDTEKIAIAGFSAGAHLAAHYSTSYDCREVREVFPESKPVNASILCYPVITAEEKIAHLGSFYSLTGKAQLTEEDVNKFSCDRLVTEKTPPAFIWHTSEDSCVPMPNSLLYARALWEHKIPVEMHIYPYGAHGLSTVDLQTNDSVPADIALAHDWIPQARLWLRTIFG